MPLLIREFPGITHENYSSLKMWQIKQLLEFLKEIHDD